VTSASQSDSETRRTPPCTHRAGDGSRPAVVAAVIVRRPLGRSCRPSTSHRWKNRSSPAKYIRADPASTAH
jgi:hypothetical protein